MGRWKKLNLDVPRTFQFVCDECGQMILEEKPSPESAIEKPPVIETFLYRCVECEKVRAYRNRPHEIPEPRECGVNRVFGKAVAPDVGM